MAEVPGCCWVWRVCSLFLRCVHWEYRGREGGRASHRRGKQQENGSQNVNGEEGGGNKRGHGRRGGSSGVMSRAMERGLLYRGNRKVMC